MIFDGLAKELRIDLSVVESTDRKGFASPGGINSLVIGTIECASRELPPGATVAWIVPKAHTRAGREGGGDRGATSKGKQTTADHATILTRSCFE